MATDRALTCCRPVHGCRSWHTPTVQTVFLPNAPVPMARTMASQPDVMDKLVSLCKRRGFIFQSSEIYGGTGSVWDYGPLGVELKKNIKDRWWNAMVRARDDIEGLDAAILMHPRTWEASGHVAGFVDPLVDCRTCKGRFRADKLEDARCPQKPSKQPGQHDAVRSPRRATST